ncbi:MAG: hypothetical protein AB7S48_06890 [Bacteroidales bacterium]
MYILVECLQELLEKQKDQEKRVTAKMTNYLLQKVFIKATGSVFEL